MKERIQKSIKVLAAFTLAVFCISSNVFASDDVASIDGAGNVFRAGQNVDIKSDGIEEIENEFFAAGMDVKAKDVLIDGSAFMAGQNVTIDDATVGGSIFAAGSNVAIDAEAKNNIWAVGNSVSLSEDTKVKGVHIAGNSVIANGEYDAIDIAGNTVTFNAKVKGDVKIEAATVIIGNDAEVGGNLKVISDEDPQAGKIASGAYEFEKTPSADEQSDAKDVDGIKKGAGKAIGKAAFGMILLKKIKTVFLNLFRYALLALVLALVFKKNLNDAYEYATKKPASFWGLGALILLCFPIIAIVACVTVIGIPVAALATGFYVLALCVARVFTFSSLVRELIFTHTSKRLNPILETVLAVLPAAVIKAIPFIGGIVGFACAIYMIGYVCLAFADTVSAGGKVKTE